MSNLLLCITRDNVTMQRFLFWYVNFSLNWFCDLFIYGGVWGFLMRTQDGIMYPHLFKNPQRVQNMRDELFSDVRTFLEVRRCAGEWLSSMWDSWQYLLLSEEEPEIRELFDRPRLPMINLYHFRWWPDLLDGCWPRGPHWYSLKSSQLVPSVCLTPVTFHRIAAMKQSLFESCWGRGGPLAKC